MDQENRSQPPRRKESRYQSAFKAKVSCHDRQADCVISNLSRNGAMIRGSITVEINDVVDIHMPGVGILQARVEWVDEGGFGVSLAFDKPASDRALAQDALDEQLEELKPLEDRRNSGIEWKR